MDVPAGPGTPGYPADDEGGAAEDEKKGGCLRKLVLLLVFVVALAGGAVYVAYRWRMSCYELRLTEIRDQVRAEGYPATLAELDASYKPVLPRENAAVPLQKAFDLWGKSWPTGDAPPLAEPDWSLVKRGRRLDPELSARIGTWLVACRDSLRHLEAASRMKKCRWPVDLAEPPRKPTSDDAFAAPRHGPQVSRAIGLLCLKAAKTADEGRGEEAVGDLVTALGVARSMAGEPSVAAHHRLRLNLEVIGRAVERVLQAPRVRPTGLDRLQRALFEAEHPGNLSRAVAGARAAGLDALGRPFDVSAPPAGGPRTGGGEDAPSGLEARARLLAHCLKGGFERDLALYARTMSASVSVAQKPYPERFRLAQGLGLDAGPDAGLTQKMLGVPRLAMITPVAARDACAVALLRLCRTAVAIERFRHASGIRPMRLPALMPDPMRIVPADPFDGKTIRYRRLVKGYRLWSVGPDGEDELGESDEDIVLEVAR